MSDVIKNFSDGWQRGLDYLGDEFCTICRYLMYTLSIIYAAAGIGAPLADYCMLGKRQFTQLWQKLCFSAGYMFMALGYFKLAGNYKTTRQKLKAY